MAKILLGPHLPITTAKLNLKNNTNNQMNLMRELSNKNLQLNTTFRTIHYDV
jgi:hypothetical protein